MNISCQLATSLMEKDVHLPNLVKKQANPLAKSACTWNISEEEAIAQSDINWKRGKPTAYLDNILPI